MLRSLLNGWPEVLVYLALVWFVCSRAAIRSLLTSSIRTGYAFGAALILMLVLGQVVRKSDATYPFIAWKMYTSKRPAPLQMALFKGVHRNGDLEDLHLHIIAPALHVRGATNRALKAVHEYQTALAEGDVHEIAGARSKIETMLRMLGNRHNASTTGERLTGVSLQRHQILPDFSTVPEELYQVSLSEP